MIITLAKTDNGAARMLHTHGLTLRSGANQVDPKIWAVARNHPSIKKKLEDGILCEETDFSAVQAAVDNGLPIDEAMFDHLKTLKVPQAKALVHETTDMKLLEEWQKREDRNQVKSALNKQITILKAPPEKRDRSEKRQQSTGASVEEIVIPNKPGPQDD